MHPAVKARYEFLKHAMGMKRKRAAFIAGGFRGTLISWLAGHRLVMVNADLQGVRVDCPRDCDAIFIGCRFKGDVKEPPVVTLWKTEDQEAMREKMRAAMNGDRRA